MATLRKEKTRRTSAEGGGAINMTPMIDIVFQMIIFFICTAELERTAVDETIKLALAPHGPAVEKKDPRTIVVDVDARGHIKIARVPLSVSTLKAILRKAVAEYGQGTPVVIRADGKTRHESIRRVMDACAAAGLWRVKFAAIKEAAHKSGSGP
ncbi:MAG TPA: biopolymer transporter ExbD [Lentisphaerae bacterium]|nr:biopolymer transporter ExbD [Lentisphaerota bacterium]